MWIQVALFVASLLISSLLQPKQKGQKPAAFEDFDFPTAEDGTPQIVVFGDVWLTDWTVIGVGNYRSKKIKAKQKGLFGSKEVDAGYKYYMGIHFGLSNAIDDIVEIKVADKSIWKGTLSSANLNVLNIDQPQIFGGDESEGGIVGTLWVMRGASDQQPLPQLQSMLGNDVPAYRGVATAFFDGQICSNSPYPKAWSLRVRRTNTGWDGSIWYPEKLVIWLKDNSIKAMNAAHIIYEAQTNRTWGRGFSESQLDLVSFKSVADQLYSEGFGICLAWRRQESLQEFIQQIIDQIGAAFYVDRTTGLWKLILIRDNYDVSTLPSYDYSTGLLRVENDDNSANDLVTNQTIVTYRDPISNEDKPARAENLAAIQKNGVILENKTYVGIPTVEIAGRIAARDMKIAHSALKRFKVVLDRRAYALQPAAVFKLSLPERGIESMVFRAIRVEHNDLTNGEITVTALQDVFGLPATNYIKEQPSLWQPPSYEAKPVIDQIAYEVPYTDLLNSFSALDLATQSEACYVGVVAGQPANLQLDYQIWAKRTAEAETDYQNLGNCDFSFVSKTIEVIQQSATTSICVLADPIDQDIEIGARALLGNEIVRIQSINIANNSIVVGRGYIDTVPMLHPVGTKFAVYSSGRNVADQAFKALQAIDLKLITRTSQQQLTLAQATKTTFLPQNRKQRPYAPANVKLNDQYFPFQTDVTDGLKISWEHRNRLTQIFQVPSFNESSMIAEAGTTYNLRIYDAQNNELLNRADVEKPYIWNVPRRFLGELKTTLHIPMNGVDNSRAFNDVSENLYTIKNDGVVIKADVDAIGGSAAFFDTLWMQTEAHQSLNAVDDHTIECRIKTPEVNSSENNDSGTWVISVGAVDGIYTEKYHINFAYSFTEQKSYVGIQGYYHNPINNTSEEVNYTIDFTINQNTYFDVAIEKIGDHINIYIDGLKLGECNLSVIDSGTSQAKFIKVTAWLIKSSFMMNGLRMTKRQGGRYGANYTPANFQVGVADPYWSQVVLLIPMTGAEDSSALNDVSNNQLLVTNTSTVVIKSDANAHGGTAARFCVPRLLIQNQTALKDKSFVIMFRAKFLSSSTSPTIFNLIESMRLDFLTLKNFDRLSGFTQSIKFNLATAINDGVYHDVRIERDSSTGKVRFAFDDLFVDGVLNATSEVNSDLYIGGLNTIGMYINGFKIETVDGAEGTVPNVENPVRIELNAHRDGLDSYQTFTTELSVI